MKQEVFEAITALRNAAFLGTDEDREKMQRAVEVVAKALSTEPCSDAISKEKVIDILDYWYDADSDGYVQASKSINDLPSVHAERTGHWIKSEGGIACSECGNEENSESYYCPWCGADMREETNHE